MEFDEQLTIIITSVGQEVKTLPFHGSNMGSSPIPTTKQLNNNMLVWRNGSASDL